MNATVGDGKYEGGGGGSGPRLTGAYESWTYGRGSAYAALAVPLSEARYVPATMELPPGVAPEDLAEPKEAGSTRVLLPALWSGVPRRGAERTVWPVLIDLGDARERRALNAPDINSALLDLNQRAFGSGSALPVFTLGAPLPASAVSAGTGKLRMSPADPTVLAKARASGQDNKFVVMAVIDDGIPFAHLNFLNEAGDSTRVEYCWLQSAGAPIPPPVFGKEFIRTDIDALVAAHGPDEDALYRRSGALEDTSDATATLGHFASHGAHVLDAAAGKRDDGADLDFMRIIAVQLPAPVTIDTTGYGKDGAVLAALHYIFIRADDIAQSYLGDAKAALPLIINFSYGFTGGPHDGSSTLEIAVAQLVAARNAAGKPTELVMPAGNSFADRMHGEIAPANLATGQPVSVPWRLQPNDATPSYLELWVPASAEPARYSLALSDPKGRAIAASTALDFNVAPDAPAVSASISTAGVVIGDVDIEIPKGAWTLARIALAPTEPRDSALPAAPAGLWTVSLTLTSGAKPRQPISCRIQRDSDPFGYKRGGKQSYFDDLLDERFTPDGALSRIENQDGVFVRRFGTVNGLATHDQVTVVSSYYADTGRATEYASAGPLISSASAPGAVRFSVPADTSTALRGALASGTRSGSAVRMSGTSMAAPIYARHAAMQFITSTPFPPKIQPLLTPVSSTEAAERSVRLGQPIIV